jgi:hypothetical protein
MILNFLKDYGYAFFLGASLAAGGIGLKDWKYWVISIPIIILVVWKCN